MGAHAPAMNVYLIGGENGSEALYRFSLTVSLKGFLFAFMAKKTPNYIIRQNCIVRRVLSAVSLCTVAFMLGLSVARPCT